MRVRKMLKPEMNIRKLPELAELERIVIQIWERNPSTKKERSEVVELWMWTDMSWQLCLTIKR
jgi:hypothetical protein